MKGWLIKGLTSARSLPVVGNRMAGSRCEIRSICASNQHTMLHNTSCTSHTHDPTLDCLCACMRDFRRSAHAASAAEAPHAYVPPCLPAHVHSDKVSLNLCDLRRFKHRTLTPPHACLHACVGTRSAWFHATSVAARSAPRRLSTTPRCARRRTRAGRSACPSTRRSRHHRLPPTAGECFNTSAFLHTASCVCVADICLKLGLILSLPRQRDGDLDLVSVTETCLKLGLIPCLKVGLSPAHVPSCCSLPEPPGPSPVSFPHSPCPPCTCPPTPTPCSSSSSSALQPS